VVNRRLPFESAASFLEAGIRSHVNACPATALRRYLDFLIGNEDRKFFSTAIT